MALQDEQTWFNQNRPYLVSKYSGQYVVVLNQAVQGAFPTFQAAYHAAVQRFGVGGGFLIKQVLSVEPTHYI